jgi:hypothetical protein
MEAQKTCGCGQCPRIRDAITTKFTSMQVIRRQYNKFVLYQFLEIRSKRTFRRKHFKNPHFQGLNPVLFSHHRFAIQYQDSAP